MGNYTELVIGINLMKGVPDTVIDTLKYMLDYERKDEFAPPFDHPLFSAGRWRFMLIGGSSSFAGGVNSVLQFNDFDDTYCLSVRSNLKNYDSEIEKFLNWIMPYTETCEFVGYMRAEYDDVPRLIYFRPELSSEPIYFSAPAYFEKERFGDKIVPN